MKNYFLILLAVVVSLASCTIEKRHYRKGYHVEWKGRNETAELVKSKKQEEFKSEEIVVLEEPALIEESDVALSQPLPQTTIIQNEASNVAPVVVAKKASNISESKTKVPVFQSIVKQLPIAKMAKAKMAAGNDSGWHWGTIVMAIFLGLYIALWVLVGFGFFLDIPMLIFGIIGWSGSNKNGNSGKGLAIAGTILAALSLFLTFLLIVLLAAVII
jgi:hypothetical protein